MLNIEVLPFFVFKRLFVLSCRYLSFATTDQVADMLMMVEYIPFVVHMYLLGTGEERDREEMVCWFFDDERNAKYPGFTWQISMLSHVPTDPSRFSLLSILSLKDKVI